MEIRIKDRLNKFTEKISAHPLITAVILCSLVCLAALIFCDPKYETNDDFWVDAVLSGALSGKYDPHLLFSNILLGYLLAGIYSLIPNISFYFVMLEALGLISMIAIVYLILKHNRPGIGLLASFILIACFSNDLFILVQFTKTSAAAVAAGGFLFLEGIANPDTKRKKTMAILGAVLFLFGSMLRFESIYSVILFLFIVFIALVWKKPFKVVATRFLLCVLLLGSAYGLTMVSRAIWAADPSCAEFNQLNGYRVAVADVKHPEYEDYRSEFEAIGIDETDYEMINSWGFTDLGVFTPEKLSQASGIFNEYNSLSSDDISRTINSFIGQSYWFYASTLGMLFISILYAASSRKSLFVMLSSILACTAMLMLFSYMYRTVYRVEYSVFFAAFAAIAVSIGLNPRKITISLEIYGFIIAIGMVSMVIYQAGTYIPDNSYKTMRDEEYIDYIYDVFGSDGYVYPKYRAKISGRRYHETILSIIENDDTNYYLIDPLTIALINYDYKPWIRLDSGYFADNYYDLGGCLMMQYPGENYVYEHNGIDPVNPFSSFVDDNIYVIDSLYYNEKLDYIRNHYYPDAQMELVGNVDGCLVWKYYIPE